MTDHEQWTAKAYEAMRQQQAANPTQAPAWVSLTHGMRQAIIATAVHAWGMGHGEGVELGQRQGRQGIA